MKLSLDVSAVPEKVAGAGRYVVEIARRLPAYGLDTTLVSRRGDHRWATWSPKARTASIVPSARVARLLYEQTLLGRSEPARGADVWHSPHYTMPRGIHVPLVVTIHDLTFFTNPEWHERSKVHYFQRAIRVAAQRADALIAVSEFTARQMREILNPRAPIVVAPHGVDLERFQPRSTPQSGVPYLLFLGTREPRKGLDVLVAAFQEIAPLIPEVELWIVGQRGWGDADESYDAIGGRRRIRTVGYVSDDELPELLSGAEAVIYPSRGEGFGLPVLEAMASGVPVITSADTVMAEVAGGCAELTPIGDVPALASAMQRVLAMPPGERRERTQRARDRAEHFTWENSLEAHLRAYQLAQDRGNQ